MVSMPSDEVFCKEKLDIKGPFMENGSPFRERVVVYNIRFSGESKISSDIRRLVNVNSSEVQFEVRLLGGTILNTGRTPDGVLRVAFKSFFSPLPFNIPETYSSF